jgi:O-antigen ligase
LAAVAFAVLALASTAWSPYPRVTFDRAVSFWVLLVGAVGLAVAVAGRSERARSVLGAVYTACIVVAVAGLVVLAVRPERAVQEATTEAAARYQGFGGNPNTSSMLLALGMPLAALYLFSARTRLERGAALGALLLFAGSIAASASRGALLAGFVALLLFALAALRTRRARVTAVAAVTAAFGVCVVVAELPQPESTSEAAAPAGTASPPARRYVDAEQAWRLEDDIGHAPPGVGVLTPPRTLFSSSGRAQAWGGAAEQAADRPVAGYGFGTENQVYVDRFAASGSQSPENSYLGVLLQLGVLGLAAFLGFCFLVLREGSRVVRRTTGSERSVAAASLAVFVAGLVLGLAQSYIYSVGNVATVSVWLSAFLCVGLAAKEGV